MIFIVKRWSYLFFIFISFFLIIDRNFKLVFAIMIFIVSRIFRFVFYKFRNTIWNGTYGSGSVAQNSSLKITSIFFFLFKVWWMLNSVLLTIFIIKYTIIKFVMESFLLLVALLLLAAMQVAEVGTAFSNVLSWLFERLFS